MPTIIGHLATTRTVRAVIALLACAVALFVEWQRPEFSTRIDEGLRDNIVRISAKSTPENRLVIVDITENSLIELGPWPWPRARIADLVEILLGSYKARTVGLDIVFPTSDGSEGDARLASLAEHTPLVLAQVFDHAPRSALILQGKPVGGVLPGEAPALSAHGYIGNHAGLARASCVGNIGYQADEDGVLRRIPLRTRFEGLDYPHFAAAVLACNSEIVPVTPPSDNLGQWRIPYGHTFSAYTVISAADILHERVPPALIADRYVLVGSSALSLGDRVTTPLAPLAAGVTVHAANLSALLDLAEMPSPPSRPSRAQLVTWTVFTVALATLCIARLSAWSSLLLLLGLVASWLGVGFSAVGRGAEWSPSAPLWAYFVLLLVAVPHEWWQAQKRSRGLLSTLSHYVAQPVLDEILRRNLTHSLKPGLCNVTVLVADMENYTAMTSSLALEDAAIMTKDFLGCLTRPVLSAEGTLDKYTGDGLVAFWGAPLPCPDHADRAVDAAKGMLAEIAALNVQRLAQGWAPLRVRIGIEGGSALVGDLGTDFRSTYTAVGDCINFASRLEEAARTLPTDVVIGPNANADLGRHRTESMGYITLPRTQRSIEVFRILV